MHPPESQQPRWFYLALSILSVLTIDGRTEAQAKPQSINARPNILWIMIEDWGPDLSCYGTPGIHTPHVDQLAGLLHLAIRDDDRFPPELHPGAPTSQPS